MSVARLLDELPALSVAERQLLILRAIEIDDDELSREDEKIVADRLESHLNEPSTPVSLKTMNSSLRNLFR